MNSNSSTANRIIEAAQAIYNNSDPNARYRSWEHCYANFANARQAENPDIDYLSLHLAFYLASWGMYRGSSALTQKDYRVHIPVVKELLKEKYDPLFGIDCVKFRDAEIQKLHDELKVFIEKYYDGIRRNIKNPNVKQKLSDTLITKILMGTMGCVPAYDQFFKKAVRTTRVATGVYNTKSLLKLADFYEENSELFEATRKNLRVGDMLYPQMKLLDMGFWQIGLDAGAKEEE